MKNKSIHLRIYYEKHRDSTNVPTILCAHDIAYPIVVCARMKNDILRTLVGWPEPIFFSNRDTRARNEGSSSEVASSSCCSISDSISRISPTDRA